MSGLLERASARADRVLLVRQPWFEKDFSPEEAVHMWHGAAGRAWEQNVTTFYAFDVVSRLMHLMDQRAAAVADALHVEQLDLMPVLTAGVGTYYDFFHATPTGARLTVQDDGRGFDTGAVAARGRRNFGLQFMRERAELVGAQFEVRSRPEAGTVVRLTIPFALEDTE